MNSPGFQFASDNTAGLCPRALSALIEANVGSLPSYGEDAFTERAKSLMRETFETDCEAYFVFNGTAANALALAALCPPHRSILCHEVSHVETDECGAPEFFSGGSKVIPIPGSNGKLRPIDLGPVMKRGHGVHFPRPGALSLTQSTELGTVYTAEETRALAAFAHDHGMGVHMDGARFANAAATLADRGGNSPADLTWRAGIDILSFGGTKNGMASTECVVVFNRDLAREFDARVKQAGQLASKMRFAGAQWAAMLADGAWLSNARHANLMARTLAAGLRAIPGVSLLVQPEVNSVFVELAPKAAVALEDRGWHFYRFIGENGFRLMCSWETTEASIQSFVTDLREVISA